MYSMIIVDDDPWVLEGISSLIDWAHYNISISAVFRNGPAVLEHLDDAKAEIPDIVLADIRMPGIDGLELLNRLKKRYPRMQSIILSGHRDFAFAQKAIHVGVFEYLVKPVGKEILIDTVSRLVKNLDGDNLEADPFRDRDYSPLVQMAIKFMDANIYEKLSLAGVSEALYINASYLSSVFKEETGESFRHYVTRRKVEAAKRILRDKPFMKVYEICDLLAYSDVDNFSRNFKKYTGMSPGKYRSSPDA